MVVSMVGFLITITLIYLMAVIATESFWWANFIICFIMLFIFLQLTWITVLGVIFLGDLFLFPSLSQ